MAWAEAYLRTKWHLDACSRLATINMGQKLGVCTLLGEGGTSLFPILHNVTWVEAYLPTKWHLDPLRNLATTDMGQKSAGSPFDTMWSGLRPTCVPSFILIRRTVWPQYTNVADRTGQIDRQDRQRSDSIGRTVLQTVAQKLIADGSTVIFGDIRIPL